jgi:hypothetical protein
MALAKQVPSKVDALLTRKKMIDTQGRKRRDTFDANKDDNRDSTTSKGEA